MQAKAPSLKLSVNTLTSFIVVQHASVILDFNVASMSSLPILVLTFITVWDYIKSIMKHSNRPGKFIKNADLSEFGHVTMKKERLTNANLLFVVLL
jgi:hypothetical protein